MAQKIIISSQFDGGNIRCLDSSDPRQIKLQIEKDNQSDFFQWFYFRASGVANQNCQYHLTNSADAAYLDGWKGYQAVASYDRQDWFRVPTGYKDGVLSINHQSEMDSIYYAYFAPYSMQRHDDFIAVAMEHPRVQLEVLGHTIDGRDLDQLIVGEEGDGKKKLWIHGRQHPGETQASWWAEGFISRLLDDSDAVSQALLSKAVFYITPNMNPDGSFRGHLRTNAVGSNLNREWLEPSMDKSPEVYLTLKKMQSIGVDFCLDVDGGEGLPYNFIAGAEGIPKWTDKMAGLQKTFTSNLQRVNPDFQTQEGYPIDAAGTADMRICTNYMAEQFNCLSMTLEMPFKDTIETPHPIEGWSPDRCHNLGASCIDAIYSVIDDL